MGCGCKNKGNQAQQPTTQELGLREHKDRVIEMQEKVRKGIPLSEGTTNLDTPEGRAEYEGFIKEQKNGTGDEKGTDGQDGP